MKEKIGMGFKTPAGEPAVLPFLSRDSKQPNPIRNILWIALVFLLSSWCIVALFEYDSDVNWHIPEITLQQMKDEGLMCEDGAVAMFRIGEAEFGKRRDGLVDLLYQTTSTDDGNDGIFPIYLTEPSANSLYYLNVSTSEWYLSERPFLITIHPTISSESSDGTWDGNQQSRGSQVTILVPNFEVSRAKRLPYALSPSEEIQFVPWREEEDPFEVLASHWGKTLSESKSDPSFNVQVQVEENVRAFVADGINKALKKPPGGNVELVRQKVREQRMVKSWSERGLLECGERATLSAIRAVRKKLQVGMSEKTGERMIDQALHTAGFVNLDHIVLWGANAALPHASASPDRILKEGEFALFDVGGQFHGYTSDCTRTVAPDPSSTAFRTLSRLLFSFVKLTRWDIERKSEDPDEGKWPSERHKHIWKIVQSAQIEGLKALEKDDVRPAEVDWAAREFIEKAGFGEYFGTRVGHGIGIEVHEFPYLNGGNTGQLLLNWETFSNEPGIYIEEDPNDPGKGIGVRHEDTIVKTPSGYKVLSGHLASSPWDP